MWAAASSQINTGAIGGVVRDESEGVLPGATVIATHEGTGFSIQRVTDVDGRFFLSALPIGDWEVAAELPGFSRTVQDDVVLQIGQTIELRLQLDLGQLTEEVSVEATVPLLQSTNAEISDVIGNR